MSELQMIESVRSPNGMFRVEVSPGGDPAARNNTTLTSIRESRTVTLADVAHPVAAAVSDRGAVAIVDAASADEGGATLVLFTAAGDRVAAHPFRSNIAGGPLLDEGADLVFVSTEPGDTQESGSLFAFRVSDGVKLWQVQDASPGPSLESKTRSIRFTDGSLIGYEGVVLKPPPPKSPPNGYDSFRAAEVAAAAGQMDEAERLFSEALTFRMTPWWTSRVHRHLGEFAEARGDSALALRHYRAALDEDPKIGLKKKVKTLEQRLQRY